MNKQSRKNMVERSTLINFLFAKKYKTYLYVYRLHLSFVCLLYFFGLMSNVVSVGLENSSSCHLYPYFT